MHQTLSVNRDEEVTDALEKISANASRVEKLLRYCPRKVPSSLTPRSRFGGVIIVFNEPIKTNTVMDYVRPAKYYWVIYSDTPRILKSIRIGIALWKWVSAVSGL